VKVFISHSADINAIARNATPLAAYLAG